ncbi:four-carbon acid sugar kinase family protein [Terribacillus sp. 179-K 1B1 HS]|uniref:four-carbon acid sugar kinase family protein n=1 Tax=Terribacillus sp. 179-K 1B1 HS TaxID=3142388 RepID=UPI0039A04A69
MNRIAIIADDLTGASDCGAALLPYGMEVNVQVGDTFNGDSHQAVVWNTDSRALPAKTAYEQVKQIAATVKEEAFDLVYKKIDSTMRGNIGSELDALYDVFHPDVIIVAPAFPKQSRIVKNRIHRVNGVPLGDSEVARDPKTPITISDIQTLLQMQSAHKVGHLTVEYLESGEVRTEEQLKRLVAQGHDYITVDAATENDLKVLAAAGVNSGLQIIWSGSSGLFHHLPGSYGFTKKMMPNEMTIQQGNVLFVIGSMSRHGRNQLMQLLREKELASVEVNAENLVTDTEASETESKRVFQEVQKAIVENLHPVLFASEKLVEAHDELEAVSHSNRIAKELGRLVEQIVERLGINRLFLTGGDTALQVLRQLRVTSFQLFKEIEPGVPFGKASEQDLYIVTKAGSFGSMEVMVSALEALKGERQLETNHRNHNG